MKKSVITFFLVITTLFSGNTASFASPVRVGVDRLIVNRSIFPHGSEWKYRQFRGNDLDFYISMRGWVLDRLRYDPPQCSIPKDDATFDNITKVMHTAITRVAYNGPLQQFISVTIAPDSQYIERAIPLVIRKADQCPNISARMQGDVFGYSGNGKAHIYRTTPTANSYATRSYSYMINGTVNAQHNHDMDTYHGNVHFLARFVRNIWIIIVSDMPQKEQTIERIQIQKVLNAR